jgi:3-hydroxybutyryl-CoA dehydrogenase
MKIKSNISGQCVLGSQIAFQTAFHGYAVMVYDISDDILEKSKLL